MTKGSANNNLSIVENDKSSQKALSIIRQTSIEVETFCQNGRQTKLHYVIKNAPFLIEVKVNNANYDFEKLTLEACLLYDCADEEKKVMCLKAQPLSYKGTVKEGDVRTFVLELTIGVLSSQHEDMNFKILIQAIETSTLTKLPDFKVISEPVQVISKPEVLKKKKLPTAPRKTTLNNTILEKLSNLETTISRIERNTSQALPYSFSLMNNLKSSGLHKPTPNSASNINAHPMKRKFTPQEELENAFIAFIEAHDKIPQHERPLKMQKLIANASQSHKTSFEDLILNASNGFNRSRLVSQPPSVETKIEISDDFVNTLPDFSDIFQEFL